MKKSRRLLSVLLALVLVFSVCAVAHAAGTATLVIKVNGVQVDSTTINADSTMFAELDDYASSNFIPITWNTISGGHKVLDAYNGNANHAAPSNDPNITYTGVTWLNTPGYGKITADTRINAQGQTEYHYVYAGYSWGYGPVIGGQVQPNWLYMDQYVISSGETIALYFQFEQMDWYDTQIIS